VGKSAAKAPDFGRHRRAFDGPAGDIDFMNALVADVAVAEIPEPMPVVMDQIGMVGLLRRRPKPEVEVQFGGRRGSVLAADAPARFAAITLGNQQLAVLARLYGGDLVGPAGTAALLRAVLHDALVAPGRLDASSPFRDIVTERFLDVHI